VLLSQATLLETVDAEFRVKLTSERIQAIVCSIPDEWLNDDTAFSTPEEQRQAYAQFLETRLANSSFFVTEAQHARESLI
jgi:hypothetical protein